jgi:hypothetical protein
VNRSPRNGLVLTSQGATNTREERNLTRRQGPIVRAARRSACGDLRNARKKGAAPREAGSQNCPLSGAPDSFVSGLRLAVKPEVKTFGDITLAIPGPIQRRPGGAIMSAPLGLIPGKVWSLWDIMERIDGGRLFAAINGLCNLAHLYDSKEPHVAFPANLYPG